LTNFDLPSGTLLVQVGGTLLVISDSLKELEMENLRLKKMYAELQLKHEVMSEAVDILKKMQAQRKRRI
jgi:uncharacterized protein YqgQ